MCRALQPIGYRSLAGIVRTVAAGAFGLYELQSKLLEGGFIGDYIGEHCRAQY